MQLLGMINQQPRQAQVALRRTQRLKQSPQFARLHLNELDTHLAAGSLKQMAQEHKSPTVPTLLLLPMELSLCTQSGLETRTQLLMIPKVVLQ